MANVEEIIVLHCKLPWSHDWHILWRIFETSNSCTHEYLYWLIKQASLWRFECTASSRSVIYVMKRWKDLRGFTTNDTWWLKTIFQMSEYFLYSASRCICLQLLSLFVTSIFTESKGFAGLFLATLYGGALRFVRQICRLDKIMTNKY